MLWFTYSFLFLLRRFRALTLLAALAALAPLVSAAQVKWTLHSVTFADGGTATGSFVYDADSNTYSSVNITTTSGTAFAGAAYTQVTAGTSSTLVVTPPTLNSVFLTFVFSPLTDAGGTADIVALVESQCTSGGCGTSNTLRSVTTSIGTATLVSGQPLSNATNPNGTFSMGTWEFPLSASGGSGTYTWTLTSGSLPPGIALRADVPFFFQSNQQAGLLGVATTTGTYNFTLQLSDGTTNQSQSFSLKVTALNIQDPDELLDAFTGSPYSYSLQALNAANNGVNVSYSLANSSSLPAGLTLSTAGVISGTPTAAGQFNFGILMTDGVDTIFRNFNLNVSAVQISGSQRLPNATQNQPYSQTLAGSGGTGPYTFFQSGGGLPPGLSLNNSGTISGAVNGGAGNYTFQVTVNDS
ncbi:MAG TPA: putative Ig domain-containing protein, partial [Bryobacteraceae bacterium]|nr:putative Ig domain-containing protein [Bryobacteraceae bacterium]